MVFDSHLLEAVLEAVLEGKDGSPSDEEAELTDMARFFLSVYDTLIIIICPICSAFGRPLPFPAVFYWSMCFITLYYLPTFFVYDCGIEQ